MRRLPGSDLSEKSSYKPYKSYLLWPARSADPLLAQQQALDDAAAGLRGDNAGRTLRLDRLVEEVAFGYFARLPPAGHRYHGRW